MTRSEAMFVAAVVAVVILAAIGLALFALAFLVT